jgi:hypothetical protein
MPRKKLSRLAGLGLAIAAMLAVVAANPTSASAASPAGESSAVQMSSLTVDWL